MPYLNPETPPRLTPIALMYAAIVGTLLLLFYLGILTLGGMRGFIAGESSWAKAQKQAVGCLQRYAVERGDAGEAGYDCYLRHREILQFARDARLELQKDQPDMFAAYALLEAAGADSADAPAMATVFRWFAGHRLMGEGVRFWEAGDGEVAIVDSLSREIRASVARQESPADRELGSLLLALRASDERLTQLEEGFSRSLGESSRYVAQRLMLLLGLVGLLMFGIAVYSSSRWIRAWSRAHHLASDRAARMRVVAEAAADVSGSSTLAELEVVLRKAIGRVIDLDACTFGRYDAAMGVIRFVPGEADGVIIPASAWPIAGTPSERFLTERSSLVIHTSADPKGRGSHRIGSERMSESVIRCPMYSGEALLGLVAVHSYTPHRYTRDDVEVIEALAAVAASAIERMDSTQERHAAEDELQQSQEKLAQAQKMEAVGLLAGGIAHDFNNLLTAIKGNSDLMAGDDLLPDALRGHVDEIAAAAERAAALTRQLLAFSRKQVLQPRVLDLNVLVLDMSNLIRRLIGEDVTLVTSLETELCNVRADPHQMGQVILNLVLNGRDAMVAGGSLRIETCNVTGPVPGVLGPDTGDYVRLSVQDSGVGMNPESVERIFEPFFTTKGVGKGTGLGLSTVYGIVNQTGGHIHVISAPGAGTTMQVVLPRTTEPLDAPLAEDPGRHAHSPSPGQTTILVVEDEASVRSLLSRVLVREGFTVLEAADGDEAIALLRGDFDVDLMITDTVMPGMDGIALARHAAEIRPDIAVLHMSGYTEDEVFRRGLSSRGLDFLQKPFSPTALVAAVNDALAAGSVRTDAVE